MTWEPLFGRFDGSLSVTVDIAFAEFVPRSGACGLHGRQRTSTLTLSCLQLPLEKTTLYASPSMSTPSSLIPSVLLSATLLLVPAAILAENQAGRVWNNRLFLPTYQEEENLHTPQVTEGTYLPPTIKQTTTYTLADSPLILTDTTTIPAGITVTINPGVRVVAHEFALLNIQGTLLAAGHPAQPITFTTNEVHPDNQSWSGIVVEPSGQTNLEHVIVEYASPGFTCVAGSRVNADHLHTRFGLVGLYTESPTCTLTNSRLQAIQYGVVARGIEPSVTDTAISAGTKDIFTTNYSLQTTN